MTQQYGQGGINLIPVRPITTESTSTDPFDIVLGVLTGDAQTMTVNMFAASSKPSNATNNNAYIRGIAVFTRDGGSGAIPIVDFPLFQKDSTGGDETFVEFDVNDTGDSTECILRLTGSTAELLRNKILIQTIIF